MGFDLSGGFSAGAGSDALEDVLKRAFLMQSEKRRAAQEDKRIAIDQQRANDATELRTLEQAQRADMQAAQQNALKENAALKTASNLRIGQEISAPTEAALSAGGLGDLVKGATLGSRNIGGNLMQGQLRMTANPGKGPTFTGTAGQLAAEQARGDRQAQLEQARQDKMDAAAEAHAARQQDLRLAASLKPAPQAPTVLVQTVDENGNPVTKIVKKEAGAEYTKPKGANAALDNRLASARVVNEVGQNMIAKLSDPTFQAAVGPAMGRASTLREFIGNPPPEFSELAGQIESYALANMGVHGMRSAQGAEQIKKLLDQHHTPASLAATIRGLNDFSTRLVNDNAPKGGGDTAAHGSTPAHETPEQRLKRLLGGG